MPLIVRTTGLEEYVKEGGEAFVKTLVLGPPGSGKTPFAAHFPKPFFIATEDGMMSVANDHVPFVRVKSTEDMRSAIQLVKARVMQGIDQTIVIDTIDSYQTMIVQQRLREMGRPGMVREDWNWLDTEMASVLYEITNLNANVVMLMHDKDLREDYTVDGEVKTRTYKGNALKGDVKERVYNQFDLIGYLEHREIVVSGQKRLERSIQWQADAKYPMVRDRSHALPRTTAVDFTRGDYDRIFDTLFGSVTDLSKGELIQELEVEESGGDPVEPTAGPVTDPTLPKPPAAKKTAAKKAAAKKTAEPEKGTAEVSTDKPATEKPTTAPSTAAAANEAAKAAADQTVDAYQGAAAEAAAQTPTPPSEPEQAPESTPEQPSSPPSSPPEAQPDAAPSDEEAQALLEKELGATPEESGSVPEPTTDVPAEPAPAAPPAQPAGPAPAAGGRACGTPVGGQVALAEGCGRDLDDPAVPTVKTMIAQLRTKTYICDDCFAKYSAA